MESQFQVQTGKKMLTTHVTLKHYSKLKTRFSEQFFLLQCLVQKENSSK